MTNNRQFVVCQFKPWDHQLCTYHNDGEPVAAGDKVVVSTKRGPATVTVTRISSVAPSFDTKPIVGKERPMVTPAPETPAEAEPAPAPADPFVCTGKQDCACLSCDLPF